MINRGTRDQRVDVVRIDLLTDYTLFDVADKDAATVVKALRGADFFGQVLYSEVAEADKDYADASRRKTARKKRDDRDDRAKRDRNFKSKGRSFKDKNFKGKDFKDKDSKTKDTKTIKKIAKAPTKADSRKSTNASDRLPSALPFRNFYHYISSSNIYPLTSILVIIC